MFRFVSQSKSVTRKIADIRESPMYCLWEFDEQLLLVGGADGLHVVDARQKKIRRTVPGVPAVFQIQLIDIFNKAIMIVGKQQSNRWNGELTDRGNIVVNNSTLLNS